MQTAILCDFPYAHNPFHQHPFALSKYQYFSDMETESLSCPEQRHESSGLRPEAVWYQCRRCTNCCRWPGQVKLTEADLSRIAEFLGMSGWDFIQRHTRLRPDRLGLSLLEHPDGSCEFLDGMDCRIQAVKPEQCRGFPNEWNFPGWREVCEAVPVFRNDGGPLSD